MSFQVARITTLNPAKTAKKLADKYGNQLVCFYNGTTYYTYTDIAATELSVTGYVVEPMTDEINYGTLPVAPVKNMFPR